MYTIANNEQFKSIEITFDGKPSEKIREALKALRFRWHGVRRVWYGYTDEQTAREAIENAENSNTEISPKQPRKAAKLPSLWERTRTDDLPRYGTENALNSEARENARKNGSGYDKEAAKIMRRILKERFPECKISVTSGNAGYLNAVDIAIKETPYTREFIKGDGKYDSPNQYDHHENSPELKAVLNFCNALHDAFDDDDGDVYADYGAHHDLYGRAKIGYDYKQNEQTEQQKADCENFREELAKFEQAEKERKHAEFLEYERQIELERIAAEKQAKIDEQNAAEICEHVKVVDLDDSKKYVLLDLVEDMGKANSLKEVEQRYDELLDEMILKNTGKILRCDAMVSREIYFTDSQIFGNFCKMFLHDFDFLAGTGGSRCVDERLNSIDDYNKLTQEQTKNLKWFSSECVAVYYNDVLQFVIDAQGYNYARYILFDDAEVTAYSERVLYSEYETEEKAKTKDLKPFYIPLPLYEQVDRANLQEWEEVTAIYVDDYMMTQHICGRLNGIIKKSYAQYDEAILLSIQIDKKHEHTAHFYNGKKLLVYRGILPEVPEELKRRQISEIMFENMTAGMNSDQYLKNIIGYYKQQGFEPVIDTIAR